MAPHTQHFCLSQYLEYPMLYTREVRSLNRQVFLPIEIPSIIIGICFPSYPVDQVRSEINERDVNISIKKVKAHRFKAKMLRSEFFGSQWKALIFRQILLSSIAHSTHRL